MVVAGSHETLAGGWSRCQGVKDVNKRSRNHGPGHLGGEE